MEAGRLSSYYFTPTKDHKYLKQVEINPEFVEEIVNMLDMSELVKHLKGVNPSLESILIYDDIGSSKNIDIREQSIRWKDGEKLFSQETTINELIPIIKANNGRDTNK